MLTLWVKFDLTSNPYITNKNYKEPSIKLWFVTLAFLKKNKNRICCQKMDKNSKDFIPISDVSKDQLVILKWASQGSVLGPKL